jgi:small-conductance mechanosensitive channel
MTIATGPAARRRRGTTVTVLAALGVIALAGCSSTSSSSSSSTSSSASSSTSSSASSSASSSSPQSSAQGDVCAQLEGVASSIRNLGDTTISGNGLAALRDSLQQVQAQLDQLGNEVNSQVQPQVAAVKNQLQQLRTALEAVRNNATAANVAAARTALQALQSTVTALAAAVGPSC